MVGSRVQQQRRLGASALSQFTTALRRSAAALSVPTERDLVAWAQRYLAIHVPLPPCEFHRWLSDELARAIDRRGTHLVVTAPRGTAKSTWVSILYVLWCICHHAEPFILLASESAEQAQGFLSAVKFELESNRPLAVAYPEVCGPGRVWSHKQIVTRNGIRVRAVGAGGRIRGLREREHRPTLVIVDDPEGDLSGYSEAIREKTWNWFTRAVEKIGGPDTNFVVIGTMIHEESLVAKLSATAGWRSKKFSSIVRWPDRMDLWDKWERILADDEEAARLFHVEHRAEMESGASVLWPERESLEQLMRLRATGGRPAFASEKQNEPVPPRAMKFAAEWFQGDDLWFEDPPEKSMAFCAVDPCVGKAGTQGDMAAIVWCWWKKGIPFLFIDAEIGRRPPPVVADMVVDLAPIHRFVFIAYESNGLQGENGVDLGRKLYSAGITTPVIPIEHHEPKLKRIEQLGPPLQQRRFKFRNRSPGAIALVKALKYFSHPKIEPYDGPDAMAMLVRAVEGYATGSHGIRVGGAVTKGA